MGLSQPSFGVIFEREKNKKKKLLLLDDDGDSCIKNPDANDNRTFGLVSDDDYPNSRLTGKCTILTIYYNNNNNHNSENNVDNNSNDNDHDYSMYQSRHPVTYQVMHPATYQDHYNSSVLTGSKPYYTATERNANDDDTLVYSNNKNKKSENNDD